MPRMTDEQRAAEVNASRRIPLPLHRRSEKLLGWRTGGGIKEPIPMLMEIDNIFWIQRIRIVPPESRWRAMKRLAFGNWQGSYRGKEEEILISRAELKRIHAEAIVPWEPLGLRGGKMR